MNIKQFKYQQNIIRYSRTELIDIVQNQVTKLRFEHILRVEESALKLAQKYLPDQMEKVSISALLHDYAKERPTDDFKIYVKKYSLEEHILKYGNEICHSIVGAEMIKEELSIYDEEILNCVRRHTIGSPFMTILDQIIFMADYIEPNRVFEGVDEARQITNENLQEGVLYQLQHSLRFFIKNKIEIYPGMLDSYNTWVEK